jgi:hypothetical protein
MMSNDEIIIPHDYLCPITLDPMTDPVMAADGQTYQRESIIEWLSRGHRRSPLNGSYLANTNLIDNLFAKKIIRDFQSRLPEELQQRRVRSNLEKCIHEREEMIKTLIEKIDQINTNTTTDVIFDLNKENLTLKKRNEEIINQYEEVILKLKKEILEVKKQNNQQEEIILSLKEEILEVKKQNNQKDEVILDLKNENEASKKQIEQSKKEILDLKNENETLKKKINQHKFDIIEQKKENEALKKQQKEMNNQQKEMNNQLKEMNNQLKVTLDVKKENATFKIQINKKEEENLELKKQNIQSNKDILDIKNKNFQLEEDILDVKNKNIQIEERILDVKKENLQLEEDILAFKKQLEEKNIRLYINNFTKCCTYKSDNRMFGVFEHRGGKISCFTYEGIDLLEINEKELEKTNTFSLKTYGYYYRPIIQQDDGNIIFGNYNEINICDDQFNIIKVFKESNLIISLCKISDFGFAVGLIDGTIKIYKKNNITQTQEYHFEKYKIDSGIVWSLLYLTNNYENYLLSGSADGTINILNFYKKQFDKLTGHSNRVSSLLLLNDKTFASASLGEIKIWSINFKYNLFIFNYMSIDASYECIRTINAHENSKYGILLT